MKISNQNGMVDLRLIIAVPFGTVLAIMSFLFIAGHISGWIKRLEEVGILMTKPPQFDFVIYYEVMFHSWQFWFSIAGLFILLVASKIFPGFLVDKEE